MTTTSEAVPTDGSASIDHATADDGHVAGRRSLPVAATCAVVAAAATLPIFLRLGWHPDVRVISVNDVGIHLDLAKAMAVWPPTVSTAQVLFHVLTAPMIPLLGAPVAGALVTSAAVGCTAAVLVRIARTPFGGSAGLGGWAAATLPAAFLLAESPTMILVALGWVDPSAKFMPVHFYGSPTQVLMLPLALVAIPMLLAVVGRVKAVDPGSGSIDGADDAARRRRDHWVLAAVTMAATLAHPSFYMAFAPGVVIYVTATRAWSAALARRLAVWFVAPGAVVFVWQTWLLTTGQTLVRDEFTFEPMATIRVLGLNHIGPEFALSALLIAIGVWAGGRRYVADPCIGLTLAALAASMVPLWLIAEVGERASHGNLGKPGFTCWVLLHLFTVRFLLVEARDRRAARIADGAPWPPWVFAFAAFAVVAVASGVVSHLDAVGALTLPTSAAGG